MRWEEVRAFNIKILSWRRQQRPTVVLLSGKSHGRRSLVGCSPRSPQRVRHDRATSLSLFTFMHWRRKWQPTPVFLPGESQGQGSLVGGHLWGHTELDTTEVTQQQQQQQAEVNINFILFELLTPASLYFLGPSYRIASPLQLLPHLQILKQLRCQEHGVPHLFIFAMA